MEDWEKKYEKHDAVTKAMLAYTTGLDVEEVNEDGEWVKRVEIFRVSYVFLSLRFIL